MNKKNILQDVVEMIFEDDVGCSVEILKNLKSELIDVIERYAKISTSTEIINVKALKNSKMLLNFSCEINGFLKYNNAQK